MQLFKIRDYSAGFYLFGWFITLYPIIFSYWHLRKEWKGWDELKLTFKVIEEHHHDNF